MIEPALGIDLFRDQLGGGKYSSASNHLTNVEHRTYIETHPDCMGMSGVWHLALSSPCCSGIGAMTENGFCVERWLSQYQRIVIVRYTGIYRLLHLHSPSSVHNNADSYFSCNTLKDASWTSPAQSSIDQFVDQPG
jgi:hypothetical protein